jgi:hypothetical protein
LAPFSDTENAISIEGKFDPIKQFGKGDGTIRDNAEKMEKIAKSST